MIYTSHLLREDLYFFQAVNLSEIQLEKTTTTDIVFRSFSSPAVSETNAVDFTPCLLNVQDGEFHREVKALRIEHLGNTSKLMLPCPKEVNILKVLKTFSLELLKYLQVECMEL